MKEAVDNDDRDMRHDGQVRECAVEIGDMEISEAGREKIAVAFCRRRQELYAYSEPNAPIEAVNVESAFFGRVDKLAPMKFGPSDGVPATAMKRLHELMLFSDRGPRDSPACDGNRLGAGDRTEAPAVLKEGTTTILVPPDWIAELRETGVCVPAAS